MFCFVKLVQGVAQLDGTIYFEKKKSSYCCRVMKNTVYGGFCLVFQRVVCNRAERRWYVSLYIREIKNERSIKNNFGWLRDNAWIQRYSRKYLKNFLNVFSTVVYENNEGTVRPNGWRACRGLVRSWSPILHEVYS